ncbi:MAG: hypothetical protein QNJ00_16385 [Woeseiaceae bacterium]|nr:hypothetical protein [Woeseiaceae bacterium]
MARKTDPFPVRQRGAALLLMMLVLMVAATAVLVSRLSTTELRALRLETTQDALAAARRAIIDHAAVQPDLAFGDPVTLPCPDIDDSLGLDEGEAHTNGCGTAGETVMGRVPWKTLGIEPPRDSSAACLWYVVSGAWKAAGSETSSLINPDSNGQLELWSVDSGSLLEGTTPDRRPVALLIAPMDAVPGQARPAATGRQCSPNFAAANFLDADGGTGISNASLTGAADVVDALAVVAGRSETHNDRIATISRADLADAITERPDFETTMRGLGLAVAECVADYARHNSGGVDDQRMPWPAPLALADYRPDTAYDDADSGTYSGRLPDVIDDSNAQTGNTTSGLLTACDSGAVVQWSAGMQNLWSHWKDHFFYVVAESHAPTAGVPSACTNCLTVNGAGQYAAVVLFAHPRLSALSQRRDAPPLDVDTRDAIGNYLEGANAFGFPYAGGGLDLVSQATSNTFNDRLYCIDAALAVSEC